MLAVLIHPSILINLGSTDNAATEAINMSINNGLSEYSVFGALALIVLLASRKLLKASDGWNKDLGSFFEMSIVPLTIVFIAIIIFYVMQILGQ